MIETMKKIKEFVALANSEIKIESDKDFDRTLDEIGLDSLDFMSVLFSVQDEYGIQIPEKDIEQLVSLGELAKYIDEKK